MSVIIIIGGAGRARAAIDNANQDASVHNWTQSEKDQMAAIFNAFADQVDAKRAEFNH